MKKYCYTIGLSFIIISAYSQTTRKDYTEAFKLVEVWLEAQKDFDRLPGLTAIVVEDQKVLWSGAFGLANVEENIKAEKSTICSICSLSKMFTAVAIMKLYDEGKLRLDDRVQDVLPSYSLHQKYAESGPITIRSLLTHSSGLPRDVDFPYWTGPDFPFPDRAQVDSALAQQETLYPASTHYQYSNLGFTILGEIVEEISGIPYEEYIEGNIIEPLGLSNTRTYMPKKLYGQELAVGYSPITRNGQRQKLNFFEANGVTPAAGLTSNVQDMGKFASWQFRLRDTTNTEILRPSTLKFMQNVQWISPDWNTTRGLGFSVYQGSNGNTWVGHGGNCPGYRTTLQMDLKRKMAYSVMINANGVNPSKYVNGIDGILHKVKPSKNEISSEEKIDLEEYVGYYSLMPWWAEEYISTWEGKLVALNLPSDNPAGSMTFFKHIKGDVFRMIRDNGEFGESLVFERDDAGKIFRYKWHENYKTRLDR